MNQTAIDMKGQKSQHEPVLHGEDQDLPAVDNQRKNRILKIDKQQMDALTEGGEYGIVTKRFLVALEAFTDRDILSWEITGVLQKPPEINSVQLTGKEHARLKKLAAIQQCFMQDIMNEIVKRYYKTDKKKRK